MGVGNYDMRLDIQLTDHIPEKAAEIIKTMNSDSTISKFTFLTTKTFKVNTEDGSKENIKVELGDHSIFPIEYSEGRVPSAENEMALSTLNADELNKKVGDVITLVIKGRKKILR